MQGVFKMIKTSREGGGAECVYEWYEKISIQDMLPVTVISLASSNPGNQSPPTRPHGLSI